MGDGGDEEEGGGFFNIKILIQALKHLVGRGVHLARSQGPGVFSLDAENLNF